MLSAPHPFYNRDIITVEKNITDDFKFNVRIFFAKFFKDGPHLFQIVDAPVVADPADGYFFFF